MESASRPVAAVFVTGNLLILGAASVLFPALDDMGMKQLPKKSSELLFEIIIIIIIIIIIMRRQELRSTMLTSNRSLEDWGKLIRDVPAGTAILDRFRESAEVIQITGRSFRLHGHQDDKYSAMPEEESEESGSKPATSKTGQTRTPDLVEKTNRKSSK